MDKEKKSSFRLLLLISTPKLAEKASHLFQKDNLPLQYRFSAEGTASDEVMDMLGLGGTDKSILMTMLRKEQASVLMKQLHSELKLDTVNSGIAFTVPMNGVNNLILRLLSSQTEGTESPLAERKEDESMVEKYTLILSVVNRGFSGDVMEAVQAAGAKGGTVIRSRSIGNDENETDLWGLCAQEEKEIVLILAESESKVALMKCIGEHCGMHSQAQGIVMSVPVDAAIGL